jgi:hypothetical protein
VTETPYELVQQKQTQNAVTASETTNGDVRRQHINGQTPTDKKRNIKKVLTDMAT